MITLNPGESFPIVRVLKDHTDTETRYVQAVIRDAKTDVLIATVNLTNLGSRRFSQIWKVTYSDAYSQGRYILITTTVYDDSGYTSKSLNYQEEAETYLIQQRWQQNLGGGGGNSIDYREIKKIVAEVLGERVPEKLPETILAGVQNHQIDYHPAFVQLGDAIDLLNVSIKSIHIPQTDLTELQNSIERAQQMIAAIKIEKPDFVPILSELKRIGERLTENVMLIAESNQKVAETLREVGRYIIQVVKENNNVEVIRKVLKEEIINANVTSVLEAQKEAKKQAVLKSLYEGLTS